MARQLKKAINAIKEDELKIKAATVKYGIPRKTLSDYIRRGTVDKGRTGPETVFPQEEELVSVRQIKRLQQVGFPLTTTFGIRRTNMVVQLVWSNDLENRVQRQTEQEETNDRRLGLMLSWLDTPTCPLDQRKHYRMVVGPVSTALLSKSFMIC